MGNSSRAGYSTLPEPTCNSRPPGARASGLTSPSSSTVDSILAERNSSKTLSSTPPLRIVDWITPEPSLTIRNIMPPLERLFCNHPLTRTCFPSASPARILRIKTASKLGHPATSPCLTNRLFKNPRNGAVAETIVGDPREDHQAAGRAKVLLGEESRRP